MRALEFADNAKQEFQSRVDAGYRGLPPVTVSEAKLVTTGFVPIEQYTPPVGDDNVGLLIARVAADGNDYGVVHGPIVPIPTDDNRSAYYTDAFTATLRCVAMLKYSDGSTGPVPTGTAYEWLTFSAIPASTTLPITNGNSAVATVAVPSGQTLLQNAQYQYTCRVTTPDGLTTVGGIYSEPYGYDGDTTVIIQYYYPAPP